MNMHIFFILKIAGGLTKNNSIEKLDLSNSAISTFGLKELFKRLKMNCRLKSINFFNSTIH